HSRDPQRGRGPPATCAQASERSRIRGEAECAPSLAAVAGAVDSRRVRVPSPAPRAGGGGRRCLCGRACRIAGGPRLARGGAQPRRAWTGAAIPGRHAEIIRSDQPDRIGQGAAYLAGGSLGIAHRLASLTGSFTASTVANSTL